MILHGLLALFSVELSLENVFLELSLGKFSTFLHVSWNLVFVVYVADVVMYVIPDWMLNAKLPTEAKFFWTP